VLRQAPETLSAYAWARLETGLSLGDPAGELAQALDGGPGPALPHHRSHAYVATGVVSNGPTEAVNLLIKRIKRVGFGFRNFDNYRLRLLLHCGVDWRKPTYSAAGTTSAPFTSMPGGAVHHTR